MASLSKNRKNRIKNALKGLKGREDLYRLRVGDYRIIYYEDDECIKVTQIIHRSRGYDWL
ncbi:MAG: type II toxin-antitoxin system RelE/ParE family toxin [Thermoplasmata archaeon]|nr:type II toxin-antitoxin system RelE/ParE family toxin [Thermoplasmata archaeon]